MPGYITIVGLKNLSTPITNSEQYRSTSTHMHFVNKKKFIIPANSSLAVDITISDRLATGKQASSPTKGKKPLLTSADNTLELIWKVRVKVFPDFNEN